MNLKQRFSLIFSCIFSVVLATVTLTVYNLFESFREAEFASILTEKAENTARYVLQVKELGIKKQKIIDTGKVNGLYNENTEIYDETGKLIYSSSGKVIMGLAPIELKQIKVRQHIIRKNERRIEVGFYHTFDQKVYYILISAEDQFERTRLSYLKYILTGAFAAGTVVVWILSFMLSKKALEPLDNFRKRIQEITDSNLSVRLSQSEQEDEINTLARSFNQMMDRIDIAYNRQKEFTSNASHELRTPVARIAAQLENLCSKEELDAATKETVSNIFQDTFRLSELISSLVVLTDISGNEDRFLTKNIRLDEIVYLSAEELANLYGDFKLKFEIENLSDNETDLEIAGDETLLKIALLNLLKNAFLYSDNHTPECVIRQHPGKIELIITNSGGTPNVEDTATLFTAFYRGNNARHINGSGIGLLIVKRILDYHRANIVYEIVDSNTNRVTVTFVKNT